MRFPLVALAVLAAATFQTGCDLESLAESSDRFREDFRYNYDLKPGGRLVVENLNGSIEILGWEKESVQITGTKYASREELLRELKIETRNSGDSSVEVRTVRPSGLRGNMGAKYFIRVPRQVQLERINSSNGQIRVEDIQGNAHLETSNGAIRLRQFDGRLDARTSNGAVEADSIGGDAVVHTSNGAIRLERVAGSVEAGTSNGGIHVRMSKPKPNDRLVFESSNGSIDIELETLENNEVRASTSNSSITLRMPATLKARLRASTTNSSITSEFDITTRGAIRKNHLEGDLNGGGPLIDLNTSNGSIRLLKL
ncbi:MAG: DUF4097 family beta strand repeat-containing protein [Acidobacteriota bacterium]